MTTDPLVGALLDGRYRIEARIANGGMSTVYRGLDVRLGRPVALKVMDARYAGDHQFLTRFHREARAIASLKHPGLVAIYDQGNDPAHPFLVMELIEGGTLRELLRERGPMPPHAVVAVLRPCSDVYSAGIMAFELLTGATPFTGDSAITVANRRLDQDVPSPSSVIDGVPGQFDAFIARATARQADARFTDAAAMGAELDAIAEELALPQFRVPAPRNSAQHTAAASAPPVRRPTRQLTRGPQDWQPVPASDADAETEVVRADGGDESDSPPRQFAGIDIDEFAWARQRSRRVLAFWVLTVFVLTGLVALAGWGLGVNINALIGR